MRLHIPLARNKVGRRRAGNSVKDSRLAVGQTWVCLLLSLSDGRGSACQYLERKEAN